MEKHIHEMFLQEDSQFLCHPRSCDHGGYILFKRCPEAPTYRAQYDFGSQIFLVLGR